MTDNPVRRIKELEKKVDTLIEELETNNGLTIEDAKRQTAELEPVWVREGYESKQAWLDDQ